MRHDGPTFQHHRDTAGPESTGFPINSALQHSSTLQEVAGAAQPEGMYDANVLVRTVKRARAEFMEMPGLKLTCTQAARLWAVDPEHCRAALAALVASGFLVVTRDACFVRPT